MNVARGSPISRGARRRHRRELAKLPERLIELPEAERIAYGAPPGQIRVWRSRTYLVQLFRERGFLRITVNRTELQGDGDWKGGISWDELQAIKREIGYGSHDAVEIYPADVDVVDIANLRHLWLVGPELVPFLWRNHA